MLALAKARPRPHAHRAKIICFPYNAVVLKTPKLRSIPRWPMWFMLVTLLAFIGEIWSARL